MFLNRRRLSFLLIPFLYIQLTACFAPAKGSRAKNPNPNIEELSAATQPLPDLKGPLAETSLQQRWIVSAVEAKQLIEQGAILLDARGNHWAFRQLSRAIAQPLQGSIAINWREFSPQDPITRGNLLDEDELLTQKLQALGISTNTPVVVYGNLPSGWGEEGRIVWMLRTLGHPQAVMVDGGFQALVAANVPLRTDRQGAPELGDFVVQRRPDWSIQRDDLKDQLGANNLVIIDTRERREFEGKTPYGEQRGGHIPGAIHLYFKDFLGDDGALLPQPALLEKLGDMGITPDQQIVVYCTGGIRSGWLVSVLITLGFQARNYAGSMWEWSAAPAAQYPLATH